MSLHLFSNLKVDDSVYLTKVQAQSVTGVPFVSSAGTNTVHIQDTLDGTLPAQSFR